MKVGTTYKNADRLAVSDDGHFIAAAACSSTSNWIWLARLDEGGLHLNSFAAIAGSGDLAELISIKGLCFSADSRKLFVAANKKDSIYAFDVGEMGISFTSSYELDAQNDALSLEDIKVTRSGSVVVSAEDTSTVYLLEDGAGLGLLTAIQGSSESGPYHPTAIAVSGESDAFYVLCDGDEIACFSRADASSPYSQTSSFSIPYEAEGAKYIAIGKSPAGGCETVAVAGGDSLVFFDMAADRTPETAVILPASSCEQAGIAEATALSFVRGAFVLGGGASGIVSVFGRD